jgi:hypothetical protein
MGLLEHDSDLLSLVGRDSVLLWDEPYLREIPGLSAEGHVRVFADPRRAAGGQCNGGGSFIRRRRLSGVDGFIEPALLLERVMRDWKLARAWLLTELQG